MTDVLIAPSRRGVLAMGCAAALAAILAPRLAVADPAAVEAELKLLFAEKPMAEGKIKLDMPEIAENGLVVPLVVDVESAMTKEDYVKAVHIMADGNPAPRVASYYFTPANGKASASTRMRLAKSQNVIAVAEMSDGTLHMTKAAIKVTIGGCSG